MKSSNGPDWSRVVDDIAANVASTVFIVSGARDLVERIGEAGGNGASFSDLEAQSGLNPSTLAGSLVALQRAALVENLLERREGTREYSYYRLTPLGRIVSHELDTFELALRSRVATASHNPQLQASRRLLQRIVLPGDRPSYGGVHLFSRYEAEYQTRIQHHDKWDEPVSLADSSFADILYNYTTLSTLDTPRKRFGALRA